MSIQECVKSKSFKIAAITLSVAVLVLGGFAAGVAVGIHKARFSYKWGENYERNFMGPQMMGGRRGMMGGFASGPRELQRGLEGRGFRNAHGLAGSILSIANNNLVIKDQDNKENTVAVTDQTIIKGRGDDLKITDLKTGDQIVVMGNPGDDGVLNATLIRVFTSNWEN
ncbi:hypothetical protein EPO05_02280 [Patescibacteria group bacterium]|nr:MAG: hypothetical protein EPO05_02280 [Patescibacteria group bacterium]